MSDFLSQFAENNNKKTVGVDDPVRPSKTNQQTKIIPEEHEVVVDKSYNKNKNIRYIIIAITIIVIAVLIFIGFRMLNSITVKDFTNTNINEAKTWGLKNNIEIETEEVFSVEYNENLIISQNIETGKKLQKGSKIGFVVSKGTDPEENIKVPDLKEMDLNQIREWITANKLQSISVVQEFNEAIEKGKFIKLEFKEEGITEESYKRKNGMIIYVSKGSDALEKNIEVPNFSGKMKTEVEEWGKTNGVQVTYVEAGSDKTMEGSVISQSIESKTKISKQDTIEIVISLGKGVKVPNFGEVSKEEAGTINQELIVNVKTRYSEKVKYGKLISQSVKSGTVLYGDKKAVEVIYSEGKPFIDDLTGRLEKELAPYFYDFTSKGANIKYKVKYVSSSETKGTVVYSSKINEYVELDTLVEVHISKGDKKPPENNINRAI